MVALPLKHQEFLFRPDSIIGMITRLVRQESFGRSHTKDPQKFNRM